MKVFIKLMLLLLIAAMAGPFFIRGPDGQPLMKWRDITSKFGNWSSSASGGDSVEVHRWQDENGQWHYSDEPPEQGGEVITLDPNTNVIQSVPVNAPPAVEPSAPVQSEPTAGDEMPSMFNAVDETKKVRDALEERNDTLRKRLDDN
ncbi:MAG: DUF4124 domain-containing protein [Pseudomonadota bacterium]